MITTPFSLGTFSVAGCPPFAGVVVGDRMMAVTALQPLCEELGRPLSTPETVFGLLQAWDRNFPVLQAAIDELQREGEQSVELVELVGSIALDTVKTHAPVLYPRQVFCAGANYRQHVIDLAVAQGHGADDTMSLAERRAEASRMMDERIASGSPYVFTKIPSAITGPYDPVVLPEDSTQVDWELELAVIIGRPAWHVSRSEALTYVAGYTVVNDLTCRDKVYRADMKAIGTDWLLSKSLPSFLPMGPYPVPAAFVPEPQQLHLTLKLNGQVMQDEGTDDMIFGVARLIEYLSQHVQLWPGDLICTGSPRGNGMHYNRFLHPGDVLAGTISGLGTQSNTCIAENT
ncbi:MAG: fumarylacetoacetate hydrolase family protein [Chloroflexota bacterium]|nr:fumarylacetoacetate hydrolase family protein [Chloroflexota bacterium]